MMIIQNKRTNYSVGRQLLIYETKVARLHCELVCILPSDSTSGMAISLRVGIIHSSDYECDMVYHSEFSNSNQSQTKSVVTAPTHLSGYAELGSLFRGISTSETARGWFTAFIFLLNSLGCRTCRGSELSRRRITKMRRWLGIYPSRWEQVCSHWASYLFKSTAVTRHSPRQCIENSTWNG